MTGKADGAAGRDDELPVCEFLSVGFHELTHGAERPLDEPAVVGDPPAVHDARKEQGRIAEETLLIPRRRLR